MNEEQFVVETPLGPIWLWGRDTGRPVLCICTGAFSDFGAMWKVQDHLPDMDVLRVHLPGNFCPRLVVNNIASFARALFLALDRRFHGRVIAMSGQSTGALVAMACRPVELRRLVVAEPFFRTAHVWMFPMMVEQRATSPQDLDFLWNVFGVSADQVEERDYTEILKGLPVPTRVFLGGIPLHPQRTLDRMPSVVDETDRRLLAAHPLVTVTTVPDAGHNVAVQTGFAYLDAIKAACAEALGR